MGSVYKRELKSALNSMTGYIVIAFILLIVGIYTVAYNIKGGAPNFEYSLYSTVFYLVFVIPILTMRSFSEEKSQKTDILLYSLPISSTKIVLGKYFAMLTVYAIPTALVSVFPLLLSAYGSINFASSYGAVLIFFLLGAAMIGIGMFMSSLTESQVIAAVLGIAVLVFSYLAHGIAEFIPETALATMLFFTVLIIAVALIVSRLTKNSTAALMTAAVLESVLLAVYFINKNLLSGLATRTVEALGIFEKTYPFFLYNVFDITSVVYYLSIAAVTVVLTVQSFEKRRWC